MLISDNPAVLGKLAIVKSPISGLATGGNMSDRSIRLLTGEVVMIVALELLPPKAISSWYRTDVGGAPINYLRVLPAGGRECWIFPNHVFPIYRRNCLAGMSFCITGILNHLREFYIQLIEAHGGTWKNTVTKKLTYLITAEPGYTSIKTKAAMENGTTCIDEEALFKLIASSE